MISTPRASARPAVSPRALSLHTLDALRRHVHQTLCTHDALDRAQTVLRQFLIQRRGRTCGLFFHVESPALGKVYAIWAGDEGRILFYDSMGTRFAETCVLDGPDPLSVGAAAPSGGSGCVVSSLDSGALTAVK